MEQGALQRIMRYTLNSKIGNIKTTKKGKELKKVIIDDTEYTYNKEKPIQGKLKKKLEQISKTPKFKQFEILEKASKGIMVRRALKRYALSTFGTRTNEYTALKNYANTYAITNIEKMGYAGLSHIFYQKPRLRTYLNKHKSMKLLLDVEVEFVDVSDE